jgi:hypothetical protein
VKKTREEYQMLRKLITVTNASVLTEHSQPNALLGIVAFGMGYPRFWFDHGGAEMRNFAFLRKPELRLLKEIWNLPEKGAISQFKYLNFPSVTINRKIYIPLDESNFATADIFIKSENSVPVRIISNKDIIFWTEQHTSCFSGLCGSHE